MTSLAELARRLKRRAGVGDERLPACVMIAGNGRTAAETRAALARLPRGSAVILRDYGAPDRAARAASLAAMCHERGLRLLVGGDVRLALAVGAGGVHLPEDALRHGERCWRLWRKPGWIVTAAAHSPAAIARARRAGIDAVLLSPVFATASHPGATPLGPLLFAAWVRRGGVPTYGLGGIEAATARKLAGSGAVGLAAISGFAAPPPPHSAS